VRERERERRRRRRRRRNAAFGFFRWNFLGFGAPT
jgi:hypothetical protein